MGAAYYIIPEESQRELVSVPLAKIQFYSFALVGCDKTGFGGKPFKSILPHHVKKAMTSLASCSDIL